MQPGLGRRIAEGRCQGNHILRLGGSAGLIGGQHAGNVLLLFAGSIQFGHRGQEAKAARAFSGDGNGEKGAEQLDRLGVKAAGRRHFVQVRIRCRDIPRLRNKPRVLGESRVVKPTRRKNRRRSSVGSGKRVVSTTTPGNGSAADFFQQPAQLRMEEPTEPRAAIVLGHFGAVEDQCPALAAEDRQQTIDAIAGGNVGRMVQVHRVGIKFAEAKVGILAAIKAPQENTVRTPWATRSGVPASAGGSPSCPGRRGRPGRPDLARRR